MSKVNEFHETHSDAFNGYNEIATALVSDNPLDSCLELDVELEGIIRGTFNVRCFDGVAIAVNDRMTVVLKYPKKQNMSHGELKSCLKYRGLENNISVLQPITSSRTTYGDIMMLYGEPVMIHHKKQYLFG